MRGCNGSVDAGEDLERRRTDSMDFRSSSAARRFSLRRARRRRVDLADEWRRPLAAAFCEAVRTVEAHALDFVRASTFRAARRLICINYLRSRTD